MLLLLLICPLPLRLFLCLPGDSGHLSECKLRLLFKHRFFFFDLKDIWWWFAFGWGGLFIGLIDLFETLVEVVPKTILQVLGNHSEGTGRELMRVLDQGGGLIDYIVRWWLLLMRLRLRGLLLLGEILLAGERKLYATLSLCIIFLANLMIREIGEIHLRV